MKKASPGVLNEIYYISQVKIEGDKCSVPCNGAGFP